MDTNAALREIILRRRQLLQEWNEYRNQVRSKLQLKDVSENVEVETIETVKEIIVEEKEEVIED